MASPGVAPAEFLADEKQCDLRGRDVESGIRGVEAEFAVAIEHLPEHRLLRDHVGRIRQLVELHAGGPHHFLGELRPDREPRVQSLNSLSISTSAMDTFRSVPMSVHDRPAVMTALIRKPRKTRG
jgi:hypothetical protein